MPDSSRHRQYSLILSASGESASFIARPACILHRHHRFPRHCYCQYRLPEQRISFLQK
ncbi:hypothetical protein KCP77_12380 [Salmonella enterica subsp. enterica]|nr:hypothetical protein KCP77_12380 [Salmonella enterica subsp. enterica]